MAEEDRVVTTRTTPGGTAASDAHEEDWLADTDSAEIEWFEDAPGTARASRGEGSGGRGGAEADGASVFRRRREVAVAAVLLGLALVVVLAVVVFGGGGSKAPATTTGITTTPAITTNPAQTGTTTTTATPPASTPSSKPTSLRLDLPAGSELKLGDSGSEVVTLQKALVLLGAGSLTADGNFGPATQQAVKSFQQSNGLKPDGIVGSKTASAIDSALASLGSSG
ncbi:MAG TPA: peptidoglycan-binding domain-containing protein [Gaiellaceae bacterium]|nr:peptidoglycan-binding domain-containing protein [Gaiellaceae bacterium]